MPTALLLYHLLAIRGEVEGGEDWIWGVARGEGGRNREGKTKRSNCCQIRDTLDVKIMFQLDTLGGGLGGVGGGLGGGLGGDWEEVGRRLGGGWEEVGRRLGGGWEEVGRRLGGGWEEVGRRLGGG